MGFYGGALKTGILKPFTHRSLSHRCSAKLWPRHSRAAGRSANHLERMRPGSAAVTKAIQFVGIENVGPLQGQGTVGLKFETVVKELMFAVQSRLPKTAQ